MSFLDLAKERYSCRKLTAKKIEQEKIERILQAGIAAPTAKNGQAYKIWKFATPEAMEKIKAVTKFTFGAEFALLVGGLPEKSFDRPFDKFNFGQVDGAIVATHLMLAIQDEGLATTWVGYFDAPKLKEMFPEMKDYDLIAIFPIGYPAEDAAPSPRHSERREISDAVTEI